MKLMLWFGFFAFFFLVKVNKSQKVNCRDVVGYYNGHGVHGIIKIPPPKIGQWTSLTVSIENNGTVQDSHGYIRLRKSKYDTAQDALKGKNVQYYLFLPLGDEIPAIKHITLNGKIICQGDHKYYQNNWTFKHGFLFGKTSIQMESSSSTEEFYPTYWDWLSVQDNMRLTPMISITRRIADNGRWLKQPPFSCGVEKASSDLIRRKRQLVLTPLILNGTVITRGEFPWLVYLIYNIRSSLCGGTLVSDRHIVTAAHCVKDYKVVGVQLGQHDRLGMIEYGSVRRMPKKIFIHDQYVMNRPHADIALIVIDPVQSTPQIRPICIWPYGLTFDEYLNKGTVAGWGVFENETSSRVPMMTDVQMVSQEMCKRSHKLLEGIVTEHTLCAGGAKSGPCNGDSGSGLYYKHINTWYLRGIVSASLTSGFLCQTDHYTVYVDIVFYLDWLRLKMSEEIKLSRGIDHRFDSRSSITVR